MLWLWVVLTASHAESAGCTRAALVAHIGAAEVAFTRLDRWRFTASADRATQSLICLEDPITPEVSGRFHRLRAIAAYMEGDRPTALRALRSMRVGLQEGAWPPRLIGPDHPLRTWDAGDAYVREWDGLPPPKSGWLVVDGVPTSLVPRHQPFVLQWIDAPPGGKRETADPEAPAQVRLTRYVSSHMLLPDAPWPKERRRARPRRVLVATSITMGFIGGSLLAGSAVTASSATRAYDDGDFARAKALEADNHWFFIRGLAVAGLGVTFLGVALVV